MKKNLSPQDQKPPNVITTDDITKAQNRLNRGLTYSSISLFFLTLSWGILMPFMQSRRDSLSCDASCYGGITSARSFLGLFGSALIGWISDRAGRHFCLYLGCVSVIVGLGISVSMNSILGLWLSMVPAALFSSNSSVCKALMADYHEALEVVEERAGGNGGANSNNDANKVTESRKLSQPPVANLSLRSNSMGKMGMSAGLAIMIGPIFGTVLAQEYNRSVLIASIFTVISASLVIKLPYVSSSATIKQSKEEQKKSDTQNNRSQAFLSLKLSSKILSSPGPIFLMVLRVLMSLAFHIFHTIWLPSLKNRFDFGPRDHGMFMSFLGLSYALSQGIISKKIIKIFPEQRHRCKILMVSALLLGVGRYIAFQTNDLRIVYAIFGILIISLGVVNTIISADASGLVPSSEMGSLFGTLEAVESGAGIIGPIIGGTLSLIEPVNAPLMAVVSLYGIVFCMVYFGYERFVLCKRSAVNEGKKL
eukprot:CAMPEP_0172502970 /NCGR_PEP_ID=MMETSP1066-20121228/164658_1 /TAXON_ID=671091 /ORGANISM="Coscinodiscus wailesii, Strain CCMP2513" /LENGTH=478 /DNA_ID=CAMNT_0013278473 /DNA_START=69 /DNA_END=1505 /DNA_ORIENTATION=+